MSVSSMRVEKLHTELFDKMQEEQRVYIEDLKTKTADEILNHAYDTLYARTSLRRWRTSI